MSLKRRVDKTDEIEGPCMKWLGVDRLWSSTAGAYILLLLTWKAWHLHAKEVASASIVGQ